MSNYLEFFGLRQQPFTLTTDPKFIYLANTHRDALVSMLRFAVLRKGFMVLTADVGMGKTMVLHSALYLMQQKQDKFQSALIAIPSLTRDELLEYILDDLQIPCTSTSKVRRLSALRDKLMETHRAGGTTVLMVDEAHAMKPELIEELRLIAGIDAHEEKILQMVLCGQPELHELLDSTPLAAMRQRVSIWKTLKPLNAGETVAYIAGRLKVANCAQPDMFPSDAVHEIFEWSAGVPRLINLLCDTSLTLAWERNQKVVTPELVQSAGAQLRLHRAQPVASFAMAGVTHAEGHRKLNIQAARIENR